jgi:hypothetical protein
MKAHHDCPWSGTVIRGGPAFAAGVTTAGGNGPLSLDEHRGCVRPSQGQNTGSNPVGATASGCCAEPGGPGAAPGRAGRRLVRPQSKAPPRNRANQRVTAHAVARWIFNPTFGSKSPLRIWSFAFRSMGASRTILVQTDRSGVAGAGSPSSATRCAGGAGRGARERAGDGRCRGTGRVGANGAAC